ncbi:MAG TPA: anti-sigma factor [Pyrinomonadaceae bacterium]
MSNHEGYKEMLALHALGALEAESVRAMEAHLGACAECRAELDEWRETAAALAYAAERAEPSAQLRSRIMGSLREQPQSASAKIAARDDVGGSTLDERPSSTPANVVPFEQPARRAWSSALRIGALAASVAFLALITFVVILWTRNSAMETEIARLTTRLNQIQGELAREREEKELIATRARQDMEMFNVSTMATLKGTDVAPGAHAKLAYDPNTGRAMLVADNLPPAPSGKAYQLWFIANSKPVPGTVFTPDARGHAEVRDQAPAGEARGATIFAVTLEPASGVSAPTGDKYLLGAAS